EIGAAALPEVLALNKWDQVDEMQQARIVRRFPDGVPVSALMGEGVDTLAQRLADVLPHPPIEVKLLVPFDRPDVLPLLYRRGEVVSSEDRAEGTYVVARVSPADLHTVEQFVVEPSAERSSG